MDQATFEFGPLGDKGPAAGTSPYATPATDLGDQAGFQIGWDHAHHGLVPPAGLLLDGTPIGQGWRAGRAVFGRRTLDRKSTRLNSSH